MPKSTRPWRVRCTNRTVVGGAKSPAIISQRWPRRITNESRPVPRSWLRQKSGRPVAGICSPSSTFRELRPISDPASQSPPAGLLSATWSLTCSIYAAGRCWGSRCSGGVRRCRSCSSICTSVASSCAHGHLDLGARLFYDQVLAGQSGQVDGLEDLPQPGRPT